MGSEAHLLILQIMEKDSQIDNVITCSSALSCEGWCHAPHSPLRVWQTRHGHPGAARSERQLMLRNKQLTKAPKKAYSTSNISFTVKRCSQLIIST